MSGIKNRKGTHAHRFVQLIFQIRELFIRNNNSNLTTRTVYSQQQQHLYNRNDPLYKSQENNYLGRNFAALLPGVGFVTSGPTNTESCIPSEFNSLRKLIKSCTSCLTLTDVFETSSIIFGSGI